MRLFTILLFFLFSTPVFSQDSAQAILEKSSAACKALRTINYEVYSEDFSGKISADITIKRVADNPVYGMSSVKVAGIALRDDGSEQVSYAYNGRNFEFLDTKKNLMVQIDSATVPKVARTPMYAYMMLPLIPYCESEPFTNVFKNAKKYELYDDTSIYKIPCYRVHVTGEIETSAAGKVKIEATWLIGKKDLLIHGFMSGRSRQFIKIKNVDQDYANDFFQFTSAKDVMKMSGNEPISEGLLKKGTRAPEWVLPAGEGGNISLNELKGKVVLLDFWGTWCIPCIKSMPDIQSVADHFKDKNVVVIGVSVEPEAAAKPMDFVHKKGYTYTIALDGKKIVDKYKVKIFPSVYIIGKDGNIIHAEHSINRDDFAKDIIARIDAALKK